MSRPDLSGFRISEGSPRSVDDQIIDTAASDMGGLLWSPFGMDRFGLDDVPVLQQLRRNLTDTVGVGGTERKSVALIDWTSMRDSSALLLRKDLGSITHPFAALGNLGAIIAATLFYDKIIVTPQADDINEALGIDGLVVALAPPEEPDLGERFQNITSSHYSWAIHQFDQAANAPEPVPWLGYLRDGWKTILPGVEFPDHSIGSFEGRLGYNTSPDNRSYARIAFAPSASDGRMITSRVAFAAAGILDNDIRALFYERFASTLQHVFAIDGAQHEVRYIGGCLRSPLILARAKWTADNVGYQEPALEDWLHTQWRSLYTAQERQVKAPLWTQSIVAGARSPEEVRDRIAASRKLGERFRRRRLELSEAAAAGDRKVIVPLISALAGDLSSMTTKMGEATRTATDVGTGVLKLAVPVAPTELIRATTAAATQSTWVKRLSARLFKPRLFYAYAMADAADRGTEFWYNATKAFNLHAEDSKEQREVLAALANATWLG